MNIENQVVSSFIFGGNCKNRVFFVFSDRLERDVTIFQVESVSICVRFYSEI